ncbi:unnamed protein product [Rotaria sp. Silwood1]|nr:unnamed protein product [Rotaria sp. Silwood1]
MGIAQGNLNSRYDDYNRSRPQPTRCYRCSGSGTVYEERECRRCNHHNRTWCQYSVGCSCNGYGRRTIRRRCEDCNGRGYQ